MQSNVCRIVASALAVGCGMPSGAQSSYRVVALSDVTHTNVAPDAKGHYFRGFQLPAINRDGKVVFAASIDGPGITNGVNDVGVWSDLLNGLQSVVVRADGIPGLAGYVWGTPSTYATIGRDDVGFQTIVKESGTSNTLESVWISDVDVKTLRVIEGGAAPGLGSGVAFGTLGAPVTAPGGQLGFFTRLTGAGITTSNDRAIWTADSMANELVAREGDAAPGCGSGVVFKVLAIPSNPVNLSLNAHGEMAFVATLDGTGITSSNDSGVWAGSAGAVQLIARAGGAAPGSGSGVTFNSFGENASGELEAQHVPAINNAGYVLFYATLAGTGSAFTDEGIWLSTGSGVSLVARQGSQAAGLPTGITYGLFPAGGMILTDHGRMAFSGSVSGTGVTAANDRCIWAGDAGQLRLIAREGDLAPDCGPGVTFATLGAGVAMNGKGQVVFSASLQGDGVTVADDFGVFVTDRFGMPHLLLREGDSLIVFGSSPRTVTDISFRRQSGTRDGRAAAINTSEEIVLRVGFDNGSSPDTSAIMVFQLEEPSCKYDLSRDGSVDAADLAILLGAWSTSQTSAADFDSDDSVSASDLAALLAAYGTCP